MNNHATEKIEEKELQTMLPENLDDLYREMPITEETTCGFWIFQGGCLQRFANKKAYVFLYGVVGCLFSATYAYFNGTITTLEKRYKIPSQNTGIISVGNDISQLFVSAALSYYAGKGHRPRWIAFGLYTIVAFCLLTALPHLIYGPGEDARTLTIEYGATFDDSSTDEVIKFQKSRTLCINETTDRDECIMESGNVAPQVMLFMAQLVAGIGGSLYYTLGVSYMDDNIKKSKTPALVSLSYFLRMLGPALGYTLASACLKVYIEPSLTPTISINDPRWLGAWWMGWIVLGIILFVFASFIGLFPRTLPRAAVRRKIDQEKRRRGEITDEPAEVELPASFADMITTFKRLLKNKILMLNNIASVFYFFGYMPYWIFTPKYIETQFRQSASTSSLVTGTVALIFSAFGVLISGIVISKFRPRARYMAAWNVFVGAMSVAGMIGYAYLGCPENDRSIVINQPLLNELGETCSSACHCDYVRYSPVCGEDGRTFISACHAGCTEMNFLTNGTKVFENCACISSHDRNQSDPLVFSKFNLNGSDTIWSTVATPAGYEIVGGTATPGSCPVNCFKEFILFLVVMCFIKFTSATGRASNFLVSVRCVEEKDKPVSMGLGLMLMSLFAFIPSPIFFGSVLDRACLVWGKTCTSKGNCWLYNGENLRTSLNLIAAAFVTIGSLFDVGVWYYVKDLQIFDDDDAAKSKVKGTTEMNGVRTKKEDTPPSASVVTAAPALASVSMPSSTGPVPLDTESQQAAVARQDTVPVDEIAGQ